MNIRQPTLNPIVIKGEPFVIDSHQVLDGGAHVVDGNRLFDRRISDFIGGSECDPGPETAADEHVRKTLGMVVSPTAEFPLGRSAKRCPQFSTSGLLISDSDCTGVCL